jgi:polyhydroxybutyrate depolymerase
VAAVAAAGGCGDTPTAARDTADPDLTVWSFAGCPPGVAVQLVTVEGAPHAWMGRERGQVAEERAGEPYPRLDAGRALWAFVNAHPRA